MKTNVIAMAALAAGLAFASAAEELKAPNGGRIISKIKPNAEFLVTSNKKIEIRFLDEVGRVIAPAEQIVTVTTGDRANPTKLTFSKEGDKLVSDRVIPEGNQLPVVLQIKPKEGEKTVTEKFTLNLANCSSCAHLEYACTCDH